MSRHLILTVVLVILTSSLTQAQVPVSGDLVPTQAVTLDGKPLTPLARVGLERHWFAVVPLYGSERLLLISLAENMVFAQTNESNLHVYDAETGQYLWGANLAPEATAGSTGAMTLLAYPVSVNSTAVFATGAQKLFSLDRKTGRVLWSTKLEALPSSGSAADEERVAVGLSTGKLATFFIKNQQPAFMWQTNGQLSGQPIIAGPVVAFASQDGRAYVAAQEPPRLLFRYRTGGPISASMGTYGTRTLLVPSEDNNLYAIDLFYGETRWSFTTNAPVKQQPLVANDDVYVMNTRGSLTSLDAQSGQVHWTLSTGGGRLLAVGEKRVYLESGFRDLFIVDRQAGTLVADTNSIRERAGLNLREFNITPTNSLTGRLYLASSAGMVVSLREMGRIKPYLLRDPKAPPFGFVPRQGAGAAPAGAPRAPEPAADAPAAPPAEEKAIPPPDEKTPAPDDAEKPK